MAAKMKITLFLFFVISAMQGVFATGLFSLTKFYLVKESRIENIKGLRLSMDVSGFIPVSMSINGNVLNVTMRKLDEVSTKRIELKMPPEYLKHKLSGGVKILPNGEMLLPFRGQSEEVEFPRKNATIFAVSVFPRGGKLLVANAVNGVSGGMISVLDLNSGAISKNILFLETYDAYSGQLLWIDDRLVLQNFVGRKGGAYGIIDLKSGRIVKNGGYASPDHRICVAGGKVIILNDRLIGAPSAEIFR